MALVAGLVVGTAGKPPSGPAQLAARAPLRLGDVAALSARVDAAGPVFFPDLDGGRRGFWIALEDGQVVALAAEPEDQRAEEERGGGRRCPVGWERRQSRFVDCRGNAVATSALSRFEVILEENQATGGLDVLVNVRQRRSEG